MKFHFPHESICFGSCTGLHSEWVLCRSQRPLNQSRLCLGIVQNPASWPRPRHLATPPKTALQGLSAVLGEFY